MYLLRHFTQKKEIYEKDYLKIFKFGLGIIGKVFSYEGIICMDLLQDCYLSFYVTQLKRYTHQSYEHIEFSNPEKAV